MTMLRNDNLLNANAAVLPAGASLIIATITAGVVGVQNHQPF